MNVHEVTALIDRLTVELRSRLPEDEQYRLLLVLAASELLGELRTTECDSAPQNLLQ